MEVSVRMQTLRKSRPARDAESRESDR